MEQFLYTILIIHKNILIPDSVTKIGNYSFLFCSSLVNLEIPENVSMIGNGAFSNCTSLIKISINKLTFCYLMIKYISLRSVKTDQIYRKASKTVTF